MARGRPVKSVIRQNIVEILFFKSPLYAYQIYKIYVEIFPEVTMRSIYYHLKKGLSTEEFKVEKVEKQKGDYSWGSEVERTYYSLGEKAEPKIDNRIKEYLEEKGYLEKSDEKKVEN